MPQYKLLYEEGRIPSAKHLELHFEAQDDDAARSVVAKFMSLRHKHTEIAFKRKGGKGLYKGGKLMYPLPSSSKSHA